jgi:hypothetical protein
MDRIGLGVACTIVEIVDLLEGGGIAPRILTMVGNDDIDEVVREENVNAPEWVDEG